MLYAQTSLYSWNLTSVAGKQTCGSIAVKHNIVAFKSKDFVKRDKGTILWT